MDKIQYSMVTLRFDGTTYTIPGYVLCLMAHGERIHAIMALRDRCGIGLKDAKDIVDGPLSLALQNIMRG